MQCQTLMGLLKKKINEKANENTFRALEVSEGGSGEVGARGGCQLRGED